MKNSKNLTKIFIFILLLQTFTFISSTNSKALIIDPKLIDDSLFGKKTLQISDLDWKFGKFVRNWTDPFIPLTGGGYEYEVNETSVHIKETGPGSYMSQLTCYTTVDVLDEKFALTFEYKVKSITAGESDFIFYLVDPQTNISLKYPKIEIPRLNPELESDFHKASIQTVLEGYQQVILVFICRDESPLNDEQEFWIQKLKYYVNGDLPDIFPNSYSSFSGLNWEVGSFGWYPYFFPEEAQPLVDYDYVINDTLMYFEETGAGTYKQWVGAATTVNSRGRYFSISFDAKMERDLGYNGNFWLFFYDASTRERIYTAIAGMNLGDYNSIKDTGWVHFELKLDFPEYENIILLFSHIDDYNANIHSKFWISNLKIKPLQRLHSHEPIRNEELLTTYVLTSDREPNF